LEPGTSRSASVDLDFDSTNPAGGEVVDERADHGSDAADDPIHDGAQDHGEEAKSRRKRHVRMRSKRGPGQRDQTAEDPGNQTQEGVRNKADLERGSWTNTLEDSHMRTSSDQRSVLFLGRKWVSKRIRGSVLLDGYLIVSPLPPPGI